MSNVLAIVWSVPFLLGLFVGIVGYHCFVRLRCMWLNKHRPLPDGQRHKAKYMNRTVGGGLIAALVLVYVLAQGQQTHEATVDLAQKTRQCQVELINAIRARFSIGERNDELSRQQRAKLAEVDEAGSDWINRLVNPPPDIAPLSPESPRRQAWALDVTRVYHERVDYLREQVRAITTEQDKLAQDRKANPLPDPRCD